MSYCGACSKCVREKELVEQPSPQDKLDIKGLKRLERELKQVQRDARELTRSGHPGVRAEALSALQKAEDDLRWIRVRLAGEVCD